MQTGAGKTYTIFGDSDSYSDRGAVPRFISSLFALLNKQQNADAAVSVSFCCIDADLLFDLLAVGGLHKQTGNELQVQRSRV